MENKVHAPRFQQIEAVSFKANNFGYPEKAFIFVN